MKNLDAKVKKGTDLSKVTAVLAGFEKQLQRNIAQSRTLSQEHVEYVQKLVVKGAEQQVGQDSWAAIKLLEVQLRGELLKLEKETKAAHYEEITKL